MSIEDDPTIEEQREIDLRWDAEFEQSHRHRWRWVDSRNAFFCLYCKEWDDA